MVDKIADGVVVKMAYRMIADGLEIESAPAADPLYYLHGSENIVPGLESALEGKTVGDKLTVTLEPSDAYGEREDDAVQEADLADFDLPESVEVGDEVEVEDAEGDVFTATVTEINDETLVLDFNSPMAGKTITFEVEVLGLRAATEDELDFGEPDELDEHDH
jgi:FKBP-type peptidyl-prolyl cis-trans isomerase SlyD